MRPDSDQVIVAVFEGYVENEQVAAVRRAFEGLLELQGKSVPYWFVDAEKVTSYKAEVWKSGKAFLNMFFARGGRTLILLTNSVAVKVIGTTLAAAVRMDIEMFNERRKAEEYITKLREKSS